MFPQFFGNICFQTFCNIVKCAYFCMELSNFKKILKGAERRLKEVCTHSLGHSEASSASPTKESWDIAMALLGTLT